MKELISQEKGLEMEFLINKEPVKLLGRRDNMVIPLQRDWLSEHRHFQCSGTCECQYWGVWQG